VLVDSEVRRSMRIKTINSSFVLNGCGKKRCLGCDLDPPTLSVKVVKNLGEKFCMVSPEKLADSSLKSSKTKKKAVMKLAKSSDGKTGISKKQSQLAP
jgi:hypothetical protein